MPLRFIIPFVFLFFFSALARADTILVWGDSLSAGYGLDQGQEWPAWLQTRLQAEGFRHVVVNSSVSGETSSGGRTRLPDALAEHSPTLVILELGANDGLRGLKPQLLADNLGAMIDAAHEAGARVLLVGMRMPPNYGPEYTAAFAAMYAGLASRYGTAFVPLLLEPIATDRAMFQDDNMHPTAAAQPLLLEHVWPALQPLLRTAPQAAAPAR